MSDKPFSILSLDGGGSWALLEAMALRDLFGDVPGPQILAQFDLALGNSAGSLVLAGLIEGKTPGQIVAEFLDEKSRSAFYTPRLFIDRWLAGFGLDARYRTVARLEEIQRLLPARGKTPLAELAPPCRIVIPAFDYEGLRAVMFRSYDSPNGDSKATCQLAEAVHASSTAPVIYFDRPATFGTPARRYWDGAVGGYNNPVMLGVIEARTLGERDVVALSIGTGMVRRALRWADPPPPTSLAAPESDPGFANDTKKLASAILDDPPDVASYDAHLMLGGNCEPGSPSHRVVRLNPVVQAQLSDGAWRIAGLTEAEFHQLSQMEMDAAAQSDVLAIKTLGEKWLAGEVPNQGIRMNELLRVTIGEADYPAARAHWEAVRSGVGHDAAPLAQSERPAPAKHEQPRPAKQAAVEVLVDEVPREDKAQVTPAEAPGGALAKPKRTAPAKRAKQQQAKPIQPEPVESSLTASANPGVTVSGT